MFPENALYERFQVTVLQLAQAELVFTPVIVCRSTDAKRFTQTGHGVIVRVELRDDRVDLIHVRWLKIASVCREAGRTLKNRGIRTSLGLKISAECAKTLLLLRFSVF